MAVNAFCFVIPIFLPVSGDWWGSIYPNVDGWTDLIIADVYDWVPIFVSFVMIFRWELMENILFLFYASEDYNLFYTCFDCNVMVSELDIIDWDIVFPTLIDDEYIFPNRSLLVIFSMSNPEFYINFAYFAINGDTKCCDIAVFSSFA
jgi:hypothetical protein